MSFVVGGGMYADYSQPPPTAYSNSYGSSSGANSGSGGYGGQSGAQSSGGQWGQQSRPSYGSNQGKLYSLILSVLVLVNLQTWRLSVAHYW